jgi:hypothetical protein
MGSGVDPRDTEIETDAFELSETHEDRARHTFSDPNRRALDEATRDHDGDFSRLVSEVNTTLDQRGWALRDEDREHLIDNTRAVESGERSRVGGHMAEVATFAASTVAHLRDGELREAAHSATGVVANTLGAIATASIDKPDVDFGE